MAQIYISLGSNINKAHYIQCALIALDEIIEALELNSWQNIKQIKYYQEIKQEIEKL